MIRLVRSGGSSHGSPVGDPSETITIFEKKKKKKKEYEIQIISIYKESQLHPNKTIYGHQ
jgi:hypothetical protein